MSWFDALGLALTSVRRRRARTALTALGVALGSALLVALGSVGTAAESRAVEHLGQGLPVGAIKVAPARPGFLQLNSDEFEGRGAHAIDETTIRQVRSLPGVRGVLPVQAAPVIAVPAAGGSYAAVMLGTDLAAGDLPVTILAGRLPDAASATEVAVAPSYVARAHPGGSPADAVGDRLQVAEPKVLGALPGAPMVRWFQATVVGVISEQFAQADLLVPLLQTQAAHAWQGVQQDGSYDPDSPYQQLIVITSGLDQVHQVRAELYVLGYASAAPEHVLGAVLRYLHVVDIVIAGIGGIAILISGLSVANALLAAVRERRREIGVMKSIGAGDGDVLRWFLLEAGLIGLVGGVAGAAAGMVMAVVIGLQVVDYLTAQGLVLDPIQLSDVPFGILLAGIAGSVLVSLAAGVAPALRAARLPMRDAVGGL
jgi:putative ABC transport system permease protein